jgi:small subunit ribosomal protein S20
LVRHKSALKRARQDARRRERNRAVRSRIRTLIKSLRQSLEAGGAGSGEKLRDAERALRKAASHGVIPKRRASRQVSRLARRANRAERG